MGNLASSVSARSQAASILFWAYQILAVALLAAASMTAFQDAQATEWRDVAIGEIPEFIVYRDPRGTFTRSVTITFGVAVLIMFLVQGQTTHGRAVLRRGRLHADHGDGPGDPQAHPPALHGPDAALGCAGRCALPRYWPRWSLSARSWASGEGGWVVLISFSILALAAHLLLLSPLGFRDPKQIHRIVRDKARVQGSMASIVEWQSLKMQEYRYSLLVGIAKFFALFGVYRPVRYEPKPVPAGDYDHALQR